LELPYLVRLSRSITDIRETNTEEKMNMSASITYADVLRPNEKKLARVYDIGLIIVGSFFIGLCAQVVIPFSPVPITGQTFAVLMAGILFGARRGSLCVLTYIAEGALGLPVFAMGRAGIGVLLGPTGGYLAGFLAAAYVTGLLAENGWDRRAGTTILTMIFGNVIIYTFGLLWLCCLTGIGKNVLSIGLYPFVIEEIFKMALAAMVLPAGWKLLGLINMPSKEK